jgi:hypothetical protein
VIPEAELVRWLTYVLLVALGGAGVAGIGNRVKNRNRRDDVATAEARVALGHSRFEATGMQEAHTRALAYQELAMNERGRADTCEGKLAILEDRLAAQEQQLRNLALIVRDVDPGADRYLRLQAWFKDSGPSEF